MQHARLSAPDWLILALGSGAFVGFLRPQIATLGTLWGIPLTWALLALLQPATLGGWLGYLTLLLLLWLAGVGICGRCAQLLNCRDPRAVVYDEYTTLPLVYLGMEGWNWRLVAGGFLLHRLFDIWKPLGIARLERLPGGWGVMADDVLAALAAWVTLQGGLAAWSWAQAGMLS